VTVTETQTDLERNQARQYEVMFRAAAEPEIAAAKASAAPQEMYVDLAAKCPVRDLGDGIYSLLRMDDIRYVNTHKAVEQGAKYLGSDRPAIPLGVDGPVHRAYRRILDPVFAPKKVAVLADQVRARANELIDEFADAGAADAYAAWCEPLPSSIFLSIMGLPSDKLHDFIHFKNLTLGNDAVLGDLSAEERMAHRAEAVAWIQDYFTRELDAREHETTPSNDMIGWLLTAEVEGRHLTREELLDVLGLLMIAGLDTITASLACFLSYFARHPEERKRIVADPGLTTSAIEELMRFESPVTEGFRITREDLTLPSGARIPAGSWIHLSWSAANLDPAVFDNPLTVNLTRKPNPHLGFASGVHRCLGSHLARMEMGVAMQVWHERIPDYSIAPGETLVYSGNPRAPHRLPLVWG
jgi:cytochrome P450